ncbi:MAG TPA: nucleotidyltransferase family protein, partial [Pyrinomonadaceae bacterium]|nr:nucleotidyltransferase family protein [Pyrinomonadaceae bacterium]
DFGTAHVVENPVFTEGCASSYRAGIAALDSHSDAIMIILGDQPGITPEIINRLADEWRQTDAPIGLCSYEGRKGHPMIFARSLFDQLETLHGDKAAWKLVDQHAALVHTVDLELPFPEDINTPDDFERIAAMAKGQKGQRTAN